MVCWRYQIAARSLCKPDRRREHSAHLGRIHGTFRRSVGVNVDVRFWRRRTPFDINGLQCKFESLRPAIAAKIAAFNQSLKDCLLYQPHRQPH